MGATGTPGSGGGANLATTGLPANLAVAASLGTAATASRADHVHAATLPDDSVTPAKARADSATERQAWRTRLGVAESSSFDYDTTTLTIGTHGRSRGYRAGGGTPVNPGDDVTAFGSLANTTFTYLDVVYTWREANIDGAGAGKRNPDPGSPGQLEAVRVRGRKRTPPTTQRLLGG